MAAQTLKELTLQLPAELVEQIQETAAERQQSVDKVVTDLLGDTLPSRGRRIALPLRPLVEHLENLPDSELHRKANAWFPDADQNRLTNLLAERHERSLTEAEEQEIEALLDKVQMIAMESAGAKWVLNHRKTATP